MQQETIEKIVADHYAALEAIDLEAVLATFDQDAVSYDPVGSPPIKGHEALSQFFQTLFGYIERVQVTTDHLFVAGDQVAVKFTGNGIGKNGREFTCEGIDVFHVNATGKIQTLLVYWNPTHLMALLQN